MAFDSVIRGMEGLAYSVSEWFEARSFTTWMTLAAVALVVLVVRYYRRA